MMKFTTLSSGLWAMQSLATEDEGIEKTLVEFFKHDARLEHLYSTEANNFANYRTMLMAYSAKKDKSISDALSIETLGSGKDAFDAFKAAVKSAEEDKPQNSNIAK